MYCLPHPQHNTEKQGQEASQRAPQNYSSCVQATAGRAGVFYSTRLFSTTKWINQSSSGKYGAPNLCYLPARVVEEIDEFRPFPLYLEQVAADVGVVFEIATEISRRFSKSMTDLLNFRLDLKIRHARNVV